MKNEKHIEIRNRVETLLKEGLSIEQIAEKLSLPIGTRYTKDSANWYKYCIIAKENQKKAIEKHPNLYSIAGKIAQQKHPEIGRNLGLKYGKIAGKISAEQLRKKVNIKEHFSNMAKRLQKINPNHSKINMKKAHETMKRLGTFNKHQREAALKCLEKNPNQLKEMSKIAHEKYPLAILALESRRKNYPYEFMGCYFDSDSERTVCKKLVEFGIIEKPIENVNIHFRIRKRHIDFFIQNKLFLEYHPPRKFGRIIETKNSYYAERRKFLDDNGFEEYPLIVIDRTRNIDSKLEEIKKIIQTLHI